MEVSKLVELNLMLGGFLDSIASDVTEESVVEIRCNPTLAAFLLKVKKNYFNLSLFEIVEDDEMDDKSIEVLHYNLYYNEYLDSDTITL